MFCLYMLFFFQAEDGIRDRDVTGVQTCALPISTQAELGQEGGRRQTLDTDDFSGGFAVWSGTSFAAPLLAAEVAELMFGYSEQQAELGLDTIRAEATAGRVANALDALRKQG